MHNVRANYSLSLFSYGLHWPARRNHGNTFFKVELLQLIKGTLQGAILKYSKMI